MAYAYPYILLLLTFAILAIVNKYYEYAKERQIAINIIALLIYVFSLVLEDLWLMTGLHILMYSQTYRIFILSLKKILLALK